MSYGHEERSGDLLALPALADAAYPKAGVVSLGVGGHKLATFEGPMRLDHILQQQVTCPTSMISK